MRVIVANIQRGSLSVIGSGLSEREVGSGLSEQEVHGANYCRKILRGSRGSWLQIFYKV